MTDDELIEERDKAWVEWSDFENREYYPRFYKKKGKFINPFTSMDELTKSQSRRRELFNKWLGLHFECYKRGLPSNTHTLWIEENTPDGRRYRRTR